jgi:hypothetical protein
MMSSCPRHPAERMFEGLPHAAVWHRASAQAAARREQRI